MDVHGYFIDSKPADLGPDRDKDEHGNATGPLLHDGFLSTVTNKDKVVRGPFKTVREAIACAHSWFAEDAASAKAKLEQVEKAAPDQHSETT